MTVKGPPESQPYECVDPRVMPVRRRCIPTWQLRRCEVYEVPIPTILIPSTLMADEPPGSYLPSYQPARSLWSAGELYGPSRPSTMMSFTRSTGFYHQQFHCAVLNNLNSSWNGSRLVSLTRPFLCVIKIGLGCRPSRAMFHLLSATYSARTEALFWPRGCYYWMTAGTPLFLVLAWNVRNSGRREKEWRSDAQPILKYRTFPIH